MNAAGVILAGGKGTRLGALTRVTNKHLLPVGPYPMIYWPIQKLVAAGIRDILLVTGTEHMGDFVELLGSGRDHGCELTYRVQDEASGIAQALGLAERFCVGYARVVVLLGDNIFQAPLAPALQISAREREAAWLALRRDIHPGRFGVAELRDNVIVSVEEKPDSPKSDLVIAGVYIYPPDVFDVIRTLRPSARGELEITDVHRYYLHKGRLRHYTLAGYWKDAGTPESLAEANRLVTAQPPIYVC